MGLPTRGEVWVTVSRGKHPSAMLCRSRENAALIMVWLATQAAAVATAKNTLQGGQDSRGQGLVEGLTMVWLVSSAAVVATGVCTQARTRAWACGDATGPGRNNAAARAEASSQREGQAGH